MGGDERQSVPAAPRLRLKYSISLQSVSARPFVFPARFNPFQQKKRAFGVRHAASADEIFVDSLSMQPEQPRQLRLLPAALQQRANLGDEFVPERRAHRTRPERATAGSRWCHAFADRISRIR